MSLASIGLISFAGLPWTVKFLWAPAVDLLGSRRSWIVGCQAFLGLTRRWEISHALWILGLAQAGSNLTYATAAALPPSTGLVYTASAVESSCGGLGTAPYLAFLMSIWENGTQPPITRF